MHCNGCHDEVVDDGHNGLVHEKNLKYGCNPAAKPGQPYPVAS